VLAVEPEDFDQRFFAFLDQRFAAPLQAFTPAPAAAHGSEAEANGEEGEIALTVQAMVESGGRRDAKAWAESSPNDFRAQYAYGKELFDRGEDEQAIERLERAKALFPDLALLDSAYHLLAAIHRRRGDAERLIAELEALTSINEYDYDALEELAGLLGERGRFTEQAEALHRLLYIYPLHVEPHERLAAAYEQIGDHAGAVRERRAVVAMAPPNLAEARYRLALALHAGGDAAGARRAVLGALELAPGFAEAQELLLALVEGSGGRS
jgi:tetratricopeptide (TPR) repeat protein